MSEHRVFYRRNLPHWQPPGATLFLTWRLKGTLPESACKFLNHKKEKLQKKLKQSEISRRERSIMVNKKMFGLVDQKLHKHENRIGWLTREEVAEEVIESLFHHDTNLYDLQEFVLLPNHAHILLRPLPKTENGEDTEEFYSLERINQSLKGYTAREANKLLNRTGQPFWQNESYDHWVRDQEEYSNIVQYIKSDPLRSKLVDQPAEWKWSSAHPRFKEQLKD